MQVYIYIYLILTGRAAAGLQNGQSYFHKMWKIGHFPVFIGWGSFRFRAFYVPRLESLTLYRYSCMYKNVYQNWIVINLYRYSCMYKNITKPNQGCICHTSRRWMETVGKYQYGNVVTVYVLNKTMWKCQRLVIDNAASIGNLIFNVNSNQLEKT